MHIITMSQRRQQPSRKRISLGAALWGGQPARGRYAPSQQAPDAWLRQLATQHKDAMRGLLTSCRQGRGVALQVAGKVGATLDCCDPPTEPTDLWLRRATAVQQALITRGAQPTSLSVLCTLRDAPDAAQAYKAYKDRVRKRLRSIRKYLAGPAGQTVTDLHVNVWPSGTVDTSVKPIPPT